MTYLDLPERSRRFVYQDVGVRMTCECCGYPTLPLASTVDWAEVDWSTCLLACPLCSWESAPATADGAPVAEDDAAERNEGYTLATAQANFARFAWMYDPSVPEPWMGGPPPSHLLALRRQLRDAYVACCADREVRGRRASWDEVLELERRLRAAEEARRREVEARWDDDDGYEA